MASTTNPLQISQRTNLLMGGYGRINGRPAYPCSGNNCFTRGTNCNRVEVVDDTCGEVNTNSSFTNVPMKGSRGRLYSWRDSDAALNSDSARGEAYVLDTWDASILSDNTIQVKLTSTLQRISRGDIRGNAVGYRSMAVFNQQRNVLWQQNGATNISNFVGDVFNGNLSSSVVITIPPQTTSSNIYPLIIRSWTLNRGGINWGSELFVDEMAMGAVFRNNLPNSFDPPELVDIFQNPRVCDTKVDATFTFSPPNLNNGHLELHWRYQGESWDNNRIIRMSANLEDNVVVTVFDLIPTQCNNVIVEWRARFVADVSTLTNSDYTSGSFTTLFIPTPWMTTPDIDNNECNKLVDGDYIDEYDSIVYYDGKPACKEGKC